MTQTPAPTLRHREPAWRLIETALGPPAGIPAKGLRFARILGAYAGGREARRRMKHLRAIGTIDVVPNAVQLAVGSIDMVRFWISPAAADYYEKQGIDFNFHQLLRFLEEPASLTDPVGFFSTRDGIIGHLMQVVHANPVYDLELLTMFDDGLDELERQLEAMLDGTHPRAGIAAIVEEPGYHAQLLAFVRAFRRDPSVAPLIRSNVVADPRFSRVEKTLGSLRTAMRYFASRPRRASEAVRYLARVRTFDDAMAWSRG